VTRPFLILAGAVLACAMAGCCEPQHAPVQPTFERSRLSMREVEWERSLPIIDVHTHTFNGRYLPLVNIALGKRDKTWLTQLLPDPLVVAAAQYISDMTVLSEEGALDERGFLDKERGAVASASERSGIPPEKLAHEPAITALHKITQTNMRGDLRVMLRRPDDTTLTPEERRALRCLGIFGEIDFLATLVLSDDHRATAYRNDFRLANRQALIVSHMMDLGPVYGQEPRSGQLLDIDEQIRRMDRFQCREDDLRVYFVAYNPFRGAHALDIVKDAIGTHHAYGVKIYPPSGYRPIHNEIPSRPSTLFSHEPARQWEARYQGLDGPELDRRLDALLSWCEQEQVPVFVHCNTGEFEARKGYGRTMAHPRWWLEYLKAHPSSDGGPSKLRLCFGHAGGPDFWFGGGDDADWGSLVLQMCTTYPNVYCEVGVHTEILDRGRHERFIATLARLFKDSEQPSKEHPFPFTTKIMYGTDWFMPGPVDNPADYLDAYEAAFLDARLRPYYKRFFLDNAIRYLDIESRIARQDFPAAVRNRLRGVIEASRNGDSRDASAAGRP